MIAEARISEVKAGADIVAVASSYGLTFTQKGKDHFTHCPFHEDQDASFSVNREKGVYHCFGCGAKGNVIQLVEKLAGVGFAEAFELVSGKDMALLPTSSRQNEPLQAKVQLTSAERSELLEESFNQMRVCFGDRPEGRKYLASRGLVSLEGVEVGFCDKNFARRLSDKKRQQLQEVGLLNGHGRAHFAGCVVFPLRDIHHQLQGFYGRKIKGPGKHYYLPGKREGVFSVRNLDARRDKILITESVLDAVSLVEHGFTDVLAMHGTNGWTNHHESFLQKYDYGHVYLLLDGDESGRASAAALAQKLEGGGRRVHVIALAEHEDPNSYLSVNDVSRVAWLEHELKTLDSVGSDAFSLVDEGGHLLGHGSMLQYTITGLSERNFENLRVTLRVERRGSSNLFHVDTVDLYSARHRDRMSEGTSRELGVAVDHVASDLKSLIRLLEERRLLMQKTGGSVHYEMSEGERQEALRALKSPTLIGDLLRDFEDCGSVGEEQGKLLGYVGTVSRLLDKPLGVLIISQSGAGKTTLQEAFCDFVPPEDLMQYTRLSKQSLFYGDLDSLKHKVLAVEEEEGAQDAKYSIRTLQSGQKLSTRTTRTDPKSGRMISEEYTVEGPVFIAISTTNADALDYETRNRFVVLTIDESEEQTKRIHDDTRYAYTLEGQERSARKEKVLARCRNMQRLLKPIKVVNPYAPVLQYPSQRLQSRREFKKYMTLIQSIALLHQYQREVHRADFGDYVEVKPCDVALANDLVRSFFPYSVDELAPHTRSFVQELSRYVRENEGLLTFTRREIRDFTQCSDWHVRKCLSQLEEMEYVRRVSGKQGTQVQYEYLSESLEAIPDVGVLSDAKDLEMLLNAYRSRVSSKSNVA